MSNHPRSLKRIVASAFTFAVNRIDLWLTYLALFFAGWLSFWFFKVLNFSKIKGRENVPLKTNVLLVSNHLTMYDSFLVNIVYVPSNIIYPSLPPYHAAARENFFKWYMLGVFHFLRSLPVAKQRKDVRALLKLAEKLPYGNLQLFYQGGRSENLQEVRYGAGYIIYQKRPIVIPVYHTGIQKIFGRGKVGKWLPRSIFRRPKVVYGKPIDFSDLYELPDEKRTWMLISQRVAQSVAALAKE